MKGPVPTPDEIASLLQVEHLLYQRWPETKRLLGLLVNASGGAHARNARRLVHASRKQDRRLQAALLAAGTPTGAAGMSRTSPLML